jgi:chemotaxis protein MotB
MRQAIRSWIAVCFLGCFAVACGPSAEELQLRGQVDELNKQLADTKAASAQYQDQLQQQLQDKDAKLAALGASQADASANLDKLQKALAEYKQRADQLAQIEANYRDLRSRLEKLGQIGVKFVVRGNRMVIQLPGDILFDSGKDQLKQSGRDVLAQVADVIRSDENLKVRVFQVAGHTDDAKYPKNGPFKDNWGLSLARARQVLLFLVAPAETGKDGKETGGGLDPLKLSAAGFAETRPEVGNVGSETDDERAKNRRVELVLEPDIHEMLNLGNLGDSSAASGSQPQAPVPAQPPAQPSPP